MKFIPTADECRISEIFSSLQGEGTRLGERHIFVRFEECHIHCTYCDEDKPGQKMTLDETLNAIMRLEEEEGPHTFVSLTGGEPLLYLPFLKALIPALKARGMKIYLETNGILWRALEEIIGWCDVVAMDMKPASVTGERNFYEEHLRFLKIANSKETFIKVVLSQAIDDEEFDKLAEITAQVDRNIPFVLQPISTEIEGHDDPALMQKLEILQRRASAKLSQVKIVPRFHKILKIR